MVKTLGIQPTLKGSFHYENGGLATVRATQCQHWYLLRTHLVEVHSGKTLWGAREVENVQWQTSWPYLTVPWRQLRM